MVNIFIKLSFAAATTWIFFCDTVTSRSVRHARQSAFGPGGGATPWFGANYGFMGQGYTRVAGPVGLGSLGKAILGAKDNDPVVPTQPVTWQEQWARRRQLEYANNGEAPNFQSGNLNDVSFRRSAAGAAAKYSTGYAGLTPLGPGSTDSLRAVSPLQQAIARQQAQGQPIIPGWSRLPTISAAAKKQLKIDCLDSVRFIGKTRKYPNGVVRDRCGRILPAEILQKHLMKKLTPG